MADDEKLRLPSFGLGRRTRQRRAATEDTSDALGVVPVGDDPGEAPTPPHASPVTAEASPEPSSRRSPQRPTETLGAVHEPDPDPRPLFADEAAGAPTLAAEPRRRRTGPLLNATAACLLVGLVVGGLVVGLTSGALRGCEAVQGTTSCGNPGFFLLVAILVLSSVIGAGMLRLLGVSDPGSTSLLGVGLLAVVALLFLVDVLFAWWMAIAIPITSMVTYGLSQWVTTVFVDEP